MPDDLLSLAPEAPEPALLPPDDLLTAAADAPVTEAASAPSDEAKKLRDRLAQEGRAKKEAELRAQRAEAERNELATQLSRVSQSVQGMEQHLVERQQAEEKAWLDSLPPAERAEARAQRAEERAARLETHLREQAERRVLAEERRRYYARRSAELLAEANAYYGLDGDDAVTVDDLPPTAHQDERAFIAALGALGAERQRLRKGTGMARKPAPAPEAGNVEQEVKRRVEAELQALGVARPNAAKPAAAATAVTEAEVRAAASGGGTPAQKRARLAELRERAAAALR